MRHHNTNRKFGRSKNQRVALMRSLARNLVVKGRIKTTEAKAKELRPFVEKLVTLAKKDTVANRRLVVAKLGGKEKETGRIFTVIAPKYIEVKGGYTRILKLGARKSDSAKEAIIEFV